MAKKINPLIKPTGKLPSKDEKTYTDIVGRLIDTWGITKAPEVMLVNRMVSTWMKMRRVEVLMGQYDLFFEQRDKSGVLTGVNMNQLAYYLKSLESDFRAYYRLLAQKKGGDVPKDFHDFLNDKGEKK